MTFENLRKGLTFHIREVPPIFILVAAEVTRLSSFNCFSASMTQPPYIDCYKSFTISSRPGQV
ncbi:MAG: hypothetical protein ACKVHO_25605, partial [Verrucomicrobiia bacterium]